MKLDDKHYKLVDDMEALVEAPPSMAKCTSLKVSGPVKFTAGVVLEGDVDITNGASASALMPLYLLALRALWLISSELVVRMGAHACLLLASTESQKPMVLAAGVYSGAVSRSALVEA